MTEVRSIDFGVLPAAGSLAANQPWRGRPWMLRATAVIALAIGGLGCGNVKVVDEAADDAATQDGGGGGDATGTDVGGNDSGGTDAGGTPQCITDFDCNGVLKGTTPCRLPKCKEGTCALVDTAKGTACQNPGEVVGECETATCGDAGQCAKAPVTDGKICGLGTCGQKCSAGACVAAVAKDFDDGNPCTKDYCDQGKAVVHEPVTDLTISCDDSDACSDNGTCIEGKCAGKPIDCSDGVACTLDTCEKGSGCKHTADVGGCDDKNPCTKDACDIKAGCKSSGINTGANCDDGNTCTAKDACVADGGCVGTSTCSCSADTDCKSTNLCLGAMACEKGICVTKAASAVTCDQKSNTACAKVECQPTTGKCEPTAVADGLACDDGDACTTESACKSGLCAGSKPPQCDDGNDCTDDGCDSKSGCKQVATTKPCNDDNACTDKDSCANGACVGVTKACDDGIACTFDSCNKTTGACTNAPQDATCDDKNPCTKDSCVAGKGCSLTADDSAKCNDNDDCTNDVCKGGACLSTNTCPCKADTATKDCDDKNACTVDSCDTVAKKCVNSPTGADGKACDSGDKCQQPGSGACGGGTCKSSNKPIDCSSKSGPCATGTCVAATGACVAAPKADGLGCDADSSACTANDACKSGTCTPGISLYCNDNNPCTTDSCNKTTGCASVAITAGQPCDDGDPCSVSDTCQAGKCTPGKQLACNDGSNCTNDYCKGGACVAEPIPNCCVKVYFQHKFDVKPPLDWVSTQSNDLVRWRFRSDTGFAYSPAGSLHYGSQDMKDILTKDAAGALVANSGAMFMPMFPTSGATSLTLRFWLFWDVEVNDGYDKLSVVTKSASSDPAPTTTQWTLPKFQLGPNAWHQVTVKIPVGKDTQIGFHFDTVDGAQNENWKGVFIDDVVVEGPCN